MFSNLDKIDSAKNGLSPKYSLQLLLYQVLLLVEVPSKKWEAMSGFMDGVAETSVYAHDDMHRKLCEDAKNDAKIWFGVPTNFAARVVC